MCKLTLSVLVLTFPIALFAQTGYIDIDLNISLSDNIAKDGSIFLFTEKKEGPFPEDQVFSKMQPGTGYFTGEYKHSQELGFFCKFEDAVSRKRRFKIDLGLTE